MISKMTIIRYDRTLNILISTAKAEDWSHSSKEASLMCVFSEIKPNQCSVSLQKKFFLIEQELNSAFIYFGNTNEIVNIKNRGSKNE